MNWDDSAIEKLSAVFQEKYAQMFAPPNNTDRKNRSAVWNKYVKNYDIKIVRNDVPGKSKASQVPRPSDIIIRNLIDFVNFKNESVANSLIIRNPDRYGQYILIPRDMAERILVIGMI